MVEGDRHSGGGVGGVRNSRLPVVVEEKEADSAEACMVAVEGDRQWNAVLVEETEGGGEGRTDTQVGRSGVDAFSTWSPRT